MREYDWLADHGLDEAFCLTFVRDPDDTAVLCRFGVDPASLQSLTGVDDIAELPFEHVVVAGRLDGWVFVLEENGFEGSRPEVLRAVSAGTEAVSVYTNVNANRRFGHAVDGVLRTGFDPSSPVRRWGDAPDALVPLMRQVGLPVSGDGGWSGAGLDAGLRLADVITGVHLDGARLAGPLTTGRLVPLLSDPPERPTWMLREDAELLTAITSAPPDLLRRVVAAEARRRADGAGISGEPVVAEALAEIDRGGGRTVPDNSGLGRLLRELGYRSDIAGTSLALPTQRGRMTDAERRQAFARHSAGLAVQAALFPDQVRAAYEVLGWVAPARDPDRVARRAQLLAELRG
ncbi:DUF6461 domain-containing protein [Plantactinospora endophytica]|uniref:DUF4192 domain-containing protein n=1 Tax=Plantactinospora endophytica TaxID=673535 RepID=A0ABQ4DYY8_9ACTN|nr:DUF6461 domain-containing protein [Plantactinospora endophytica]GIG87679.1 hypothetical protein Pen02_26150 [Plantactinospora endophytica]